LLLRDIELIVFARNGYPQPDMEQHKRNGYAPLFWLGPEQGFNGVYSSTAIRRALLLNRKVCPQGLEPSVYDYIIKHDLYRE
jgi:nicotinate-nucleotide adenylyltransferase